MQKVINIISTLFTKPKTNRRPQLHKMTFDDLMFAIDTNTFFDEDHSGGDNKELVCS